MCWLVYQARDRLQARKWSGQRLIALLRPRLKPQAAAQLNACSTQCDAWDTMITGSGH
jgi:hypothetical protein